MFQTINHYSQDMLYMDVFIDEEYLLFMAKPGAKVLCMLGGRGAPPCKRSLVLYELCPFMHKL